MTTQPRQALEDTLTSRSARGLDFPGVVLCDEAEVQRVRDFFWLHATGDVLLVGEDEEQRVLHFSVLDDAGEFGFGFFDAVAVVAVDYED